MSSYTALLILAALAAERLYTEIVVRRAATILTRRRRHELVKAIRARPSDTLLTTPDGQHALMIGRRQQLGLVRTWVVDRVPIAAWDAAVSDFNCEHRHTTITMDTFQLTRRILTMARGAVAVTPDETGNPGWPACDPPDQGRPNRAAGGVRWIHFLARTGVRRASPTDVTELITQLRDAEPQRRRRTEPAGGTVVVRMAVQYQEWSLKRWYCYAATSTGGCTTWTATGSWCCRTRWTTRSARPGARVENSRPILDPDEED